MPSVSVSVSVGGPVAPAGGVASIVPVGSIGFVATGGQSLDLGVNSTPILSAAALSNALMLEYPRPVVDGKLTADNLDTPFDPGVITSTPALAESVSTNLSGDYGETPLSGMALHFDPLTSQPIIYVAAGRGAAPIANISAGSWHFANLGAMVDMIKSITGLNVHHLATLLVHGEADANLSTPEATYQAAVVDWFRDTNRYLAYKGVTGTPVNIMTQCGAFSLGSPLKAIQNAQLNASFTEGIHLRQLYDLTYVDFAHLTATGSRSLGDKAGDSYVNDISDLRPIAISDSGSVITITYDRDLAAFDTSMTNSGSDRGVRIDVGTITGVVVNGADLEVSYTGGPPTLVSVAQDTTLVNPDPPSDSQSHITDGTYRSVGFELPTTWAAPAADPYVPPTYTHTPSTEEQGIIDLPGFGTWKRFDPDLMDGIRLPCYGKSGNDATAVGVVPIASTINGNNCMDFGGLLHFTSDRAEMATGSYTVVCIGRLDDVLNNQLICTHNGTNRRFYLTSNTNLIWGTGTANGNTFAQGTGSPFCFISSYDYVNKEFNERLNGGTTVTTAGHANYLNNPNHFTSLIYGGLMNSGTVINRTTDTLCDVMIFHRDLITDGDHVAIETYASNYWGVVIT